ncbi:hypothetical protein C0214_19500 [Methylobacterium sp. DM1]|nr:hypothetical protein C0214_19500 [Methylobacterium sp. DM1]
MINDEMITALGTSAANIMNRCLSLTSEEDRRAAILSAYADGSVETRLSLFYVAAFLLADKCGGVRLVSMQDTAGEA